MKRFLKKFGIILLCAFAAASAFAQPQMQSVTVIGVGADSRNPLTYVPTSYKQQFIDGTYQTVVDVQGGNTVTLQVTATVGTANNMDTGTFQVYEAGGTLLATYNTKAADAINSPRTTYRATITVPLNFLGTQIRLFVMGTNNGGTRGAAMEVVVWQNVVRLYAQDFGVPNPTTAIVQPAGLVPQPNPLFPGYQYVASAQPQTNQYTLARTLINQTTFATWSNIFSDRTTGVMISGTPAQRTGLAAIINSTDYLSLAANQKWGAVNGATYGINVAVPSILYEDIITLDDGLCVDGEMYVSFWGMSMCTAAKTPVSGLAPRMAILVRKVSNGEVIASFPLENPGPNTSLPYSGQAGSTGAGNYIKFNNGENWFHQFNTLFTVPPGETEVKFQIVNYNADSNGNDLALDDVEVYIVPKSMNLPTDIGAYHQELSGAMNTYVYMYDATNLLMETVSITGTPSTQLPTPSVGQIQYRWIYNTSVNFNLLDPSTWVTAPLRMLPLQTTATLSATARPYANLPGSDFLDYANYHWADTVWITPPSSPGADDGVIDYLKNPNLPSGYYRLVAGSPANFNNSDNPNEWDFGCLAISPPLKIVINESNSVKIFYSPGIGQTGDNLAVAKGPYGLIGIRYNDDQGGTGIPCKSDDHIVLSGEGLIPPDGMYFYAWRGSDGNIYTVNQSTFFDVCATIAFSFTAMYAPLPQMKFNTCVDSIVIDIPVRGYQSLVKTDMSKLIRNAQVAGDSVVIVWAKLDLTQWNTTSTPPTTDYNLYDINGQPRKRVFRSGHALAPDTVIWLYGRPPSNLNPITICNNDAGEVFATLTTNWSNYNPETGDTYTLYRPSNITDTPAFDPANNYSRPSSTVTESRPTCRVSVEPCPPDKEIDWTGFSKRITFLRQLKIDVATGVVSMSDNVTDTINDGMSRQIVYRYPGNFRESVGFRLVSNFFGQTKNAYLSTGLISDKDDFIPIDIIFVPLKMIWTPHEIGGLGSGVFSQDWNDYRNWTIAQEMPEISYEQDADGWYIGYNPNNLTGRDGKGGFTTPIFAKFAPDADNDGDDSNDLIKAVPWECTSVVIPANSKSFPDLTYGITNYQVQADTITQSSDTRPLCHNVVFDYGPDKNNTDIISALLIRPDLLVYHHAYLKLAKTANRWHLLSAPLQHMYTGDFYSQHRNPFKDIMPDGRPLWVLASLHEIANPQTGGTTPANVNIAGFTGTFNNPEVEIAAGQGFAIWFNNGVSFNNTSFEPCVMWLPKNDLVHNIWSAPDNIVATRDITRGGETRFTFENAMDMGGTVALQASASAPGKLILIGNPFMSNWNFEYFAAENIKVETSINDVTNKVVRDTTFLIAPKFAFLPPNSFGRNDNAGNFEWVEGVYNDLTETWSWYNTYTSRDTTQWIEPWQAIMVYSAAPFANLKTHVLSTDPNASPNIIRTKSQSLRNTAVNSGVPRQLKITAQKDGRTHTTRLRYSEKSTNQYDFREDTKVLFQQSMRPNDPIPIGIYSRSACHEALTINAFGDTKQIIWIGLRTNTTGLIRLSFEGIDDFLTDYNVYINNVKTKEKISLRTKSFYDYDKTDINEFCDEVLFLSFERIINDPTTIYPPAQGDDNIRIAANGGELRVVGNSLLQSVEVYCLMGRQIVKTENINSPVYSVNLPGSMFYIVKAKTAGTELRTKIRMH